MPIAGLHWEHNVPKDSASLPQTRHALTRLMVATAMRIPGATNTIRGCSSVSFLSVGGHGMVTPRGCTSHFLGITSFSCCDI